MRCAHPLFVIAIIALFMTSNPGQAQQVDNITENSDPVSFEGGGTVNIQQGVTVSGEPPNVKSLEAVAIEALEVELRLRHTLCRNGWNQKRENQEHDGPGKPFLLPFHRFRVSHPG